MHLLPALAFASLSSSLAFVSNQQIFILWLPLAGMLFALAVTLAGMWTAVQNERARHETLRQAIEKGQPLTPDMLDEDYRPGSGVSATPRSRVERRHDRAMNDLRGGLVLLGVAGGLYFIVPFVAPLVGLIGVALLICWLVERRQISDLERGDR